MVWLYNTGIYYLLLLRWVNIAPSKILLLVGKIHVLVHVRVNACSHILYLVLLGLPFQREVVVHSTKRSIQASTITSVTSIASISLLIRSSIIAG